MKYQVLFGFTVEVSCPAVANFRRLFRVKSGYFEHEVNLESNHVCFIFYLLE